MDKELKEINDKILEHKALLNNCSLRLKQGRASFSLIKNWFYNRNMIDRLNEKRRIFLETNNYTIKGAKK